jgi:L-fuconolactonase
VDLDILDIHPHIISTDEKRYPRAPIGGNQSDWSAERPTSINQMIAAQDKAGVRKAALVQASTCYGHDSSYVADAIAARPDRFTGVFSCDIIQPNATVEMNRWIGKGMTGMRVFTTGSTMPGQADWLDSPETFPAWALAAEKNIPVALQMTAKAIPQVINLITRFPKLRVVLDHLARPVQEDGPPYKGADSLWSLVPYKNVFLKATERNFEGAHKGKAIPETFFGRLVSDFGASRIAWGSNFPASERTLPQLVALAQENLSFLPAHDREWIFAGTAKVLYPALA